MRAKTRLGFVLAVLLAGCKHVAAAPSVEVADDIDAIEAAVAARQAELSAQGVVVAYRDVPTAAQAGVEPGAAASPGGDDPMLVAPDPDAPVVADDAGHSSELDAAPITATAPPEPREAMDEDRSDRTRRRDRRSKSVESRRADDGAPTRCERLCGLAESTCDLSDRVCRLAARHLGDVRYVAACRRAQDQCQAVRRQCEACAV